MEGVFYKEDPQYPKLLKQIKGAPKQLYCKDRSHSEFSERFSPENSFSQAHTSKFSRALSQREPYASQKLRSVRSQSESKSFIADFDLSIFENCLAVIGSRRLTTYGERVIEQMVSEIAMARLDSAGQAGVTIVSGFMYGGDAAAHEAAIKAGGRTIAVMPCGIDLIHPAHQKKLYREILENKGLIVSEYEGDTKPALWTYPQRNRIVAGLSKALLVIEAEEKSGCLITANYAKKFGRKVFAVPGPITGSLSKGTNLLIRHGAEMVLSARDVLRYFDRSHSDFSERFSPENSSSQAHTSKFSHALSQREPYASQKLQSVRSKEPVICSLEDEILQLLEREPLGIDELSRGLEMLVSELSVKLSLMEIKGLVKLRGGKYCVD